MQIESAYNTRLVVRSLVCHKDWCKFLVISTVAIAKDAVVLGTASPYI